MPELKIARDGEARYVRYGSEILRYKAGREIAANLDLAGLIVCGRLSMRNAAMLSKGITELRKGDRVEA